MAPLTTMVPARFGGPTADGGQGPVRLRSLLELDRWPAAVALYAILGGLACFWRIGATGLVSMEGMVVDGARHMLDSGDWLVPRVYGEIYTYKPALAYWLASIPLRLASQPAEWLIRLPFAGCGFVMGLVVLLLVGSAAGRRAGLLSALAAVGGVLFLQKARLAEFDIVVAAGVGVAVAAACYNLAAERARAGIWMLAYLALAAGFLAKGMPALMVFGPGVIVAGVVSGRFRRLLRPSHAAAALLFVAITGGYLWIVYQTAGAEAFEQPLLESQVRGFGWKWRQGGDVLSKTDGFRFAAGGGDLGASPAGALALTLGKPALIWAAFLPWSLLLPFYGRRVGWRSATTAGRLGRAAGAFLAAGTLGFMAVPTHEMRYYLPLCVPAAVLCGLTAAGRSPRAGRLGRVTLIAAAAIALVTVLSGLVVLPSPQVGAVSRLAIVLVGTAGGAALLVLGRRPVRGRVGAFLVIASLCVMAAESLGFQPYRASKRDLSPQALELSRYLPTEEAVWVLGPSDLAGKHASLYYYLERPVLSFRPGRLPSGAAWCVLTSQAVDRLTETTGLVFRETGRSEHVWWSYRVGRCSGDVGAMAGG